MFLDIVSYKSRLFIQINSIQNKSRALIYTDR